MYWDWSDCCLLLKCLPLKCLLQTSTACFAGQAQHVNALADAALYASSVQLCTQGSVHNSHTQVCNMLAKLVLTTCVQLCA